ncbi:MAG: hypothetical protein J2P57_13020 [Acidimicrobiaceae bacterium]|nr:hypothetical protein [Acidimicrobiaceae bacterium]
MMFYAGGMRIYGTLRHPAAARAAVPAALLIAGSGPTDRNGNSPEVNGSIGTLQTLADWLSDDGVASLRYDKLGTGQTGLGPFATKPDAITPAPFEREAASGLSWLAAQPGLDRTRLLVIGHSEGALYALLLATHAVAAPPVAGVGLLEPASRRVLDTLDEQLSAKIAAAQASGQLTAAQAAQLKTTLASTITTVRNGGTAPAGLPPLLATAFNPATSLFLSDENRLDPATLASRLPSGTPVLVTCSNADIQISCADVNHLVGGLNQAHTSTDFVHLDGVDHILKQDPSRTAANYGKPLPFSPQLHQALAAFLKTHGLGAEG